MREDQRQEDSCTADPKVDKEKKIIAFILSGKVRMSVFTYLTFQPSYAYKIVEDLELNVSSVIRSLKDMNKMKIVECVNPSSYRRKYYQLTSRALKLKEKILKYV